MFPRVRVEHEINERAFELRAQPDVDGEPRPGDFSGALEIENPEVGADIPVGFGFEVEGPGLADGAYDDIVFGGFPYRDGFVGNVGDAGQQLAVARIHLIGNSGEGGDALADFAGDALQLGGVGPLFAKFGDFA